MPVAILEDDSSQAGLLAIGSNSLTVIGTFWRAAQILCERCSANFEWTTSVALLGLCLHERTGSGRALFVRRRDYRCAKRDQGPSIPEVRYGQTGLTSLVCADSHAPQRSAHYSKSRSRSVLNHAAPMRCLSGPTERALERGQLRGHRWQCCVTGSGLGIATHDDEVFLANRARVELTAHRSRRPRRCFASVNLTQGTSV